MIKIHEIKQCYRPLPLHNATVYHAALGSMRTNEKRGNNKPICQPVSERKKERSFLSSQNIEKTPTDDLFLS